jgi:general stress protein 26
MAEDFEDVRSFTLSEIDEAVLLDRQIECVFMWATRDGSPLGVIMNYVYERGHFWLTAVEQRQRVPAIRRNPNVAVSITSRGTDIGHSQALTYRGRATVRDDRETKDWFYPALAARVRPASGSQQAAFVQFLDSPNRIVFDVEPTVRIAFDSAPMFADKPDVGAGRHETTGTAR